MKQKIKQLLEYNPETGELRRKGYSKEGPVSIDRHRGWPRLTLLGKHYNAKFVIWYLQTDYWPERNEIKSLDGDNFNLKWTNLYRIKDKHKFCQKCKEEKPHEDFDKQGDFGLRPNCKSCTKKNYELSHSYEYRIEKRYGLSMEQYEKMEQEQNRGCAICGQRDEGRRLVVDHCHTTQQVRGLLCNHCNTAIGAFKDDPRLLLKAAKYLVDSAPKD